MLGIHFMSIITGGLMVCISKDKAQGFCEELKVYNQMLCIVYWLFNVAGIRWSPCMDYWWCNTRYSSPRTFQLSYSNFDVLGNKTASINSDFKIVEVDNTAVPPYSQ